MVWVGGLSDGKVKFEIDESAVAQTLQTNDISSIQPVGWLNDDSLLIETRASNWEDAHIVRLSLKDHNLYQFSQGAFIGFVY